MSLDFQLLKIKVQASSITRKLQAVEQIKDGWDPEDDNEFALCRMEIGLQIEYATHTSEELVTMTEQLPSNPPAYNDNPDEQRQRQLEVLVLSAGLHDHITGLEDRLVALKQQVNDALGTRVQEACSRARQVHTEAHDIITVAKKLRVEDSTQ
jgi:hypothetical protein